MDGARGCLVVLPPHHLGVDKAAGSARGDSLCRASGPQEKSCEWCSGKEKFEYRDFGAKNGPARK